VPAPAPTQLKEKFVAYTPPPEFVAVYALPDANAGSAAIESAAKIPMPAKIFFM
jgi:hypothetical protein